MWRIGIWGIAGDALWRTWPPKGWGGSPAARVGGLGDDSGVGPPRCLRVQIPCQQTYRSLGSRLARDTPERVYAAGVYSPVAPGVGGFSRPGPGSPRYYSRLGQPAENGTLSFIGRGPSRTKWG